jgi:hypothetical protein
MKEMFCASFAHKGNAILQRLQSLHKSAFIHKWALALPNHLLSQAPKRHQPITIRSLCFLNAWSLVTIYLKPMMNDKFGPCTIDEWRLKRNNMILHNQMLRNKVGVE